MSISTKTVILAIASYLVYTFVVKPSTLELDQVLETGGRRNKTGWRERDLVWFIQISDLHISRYIYPDIKDDLKEFFTSTLDTVKPVIVLASGDLTDAKDVDGVDSYQQQEEWRFYRKLIENYVKNKTIYVDIRGNHDTFDVQSFSDKNNLFRTNSASGLKYNSSYSTTLTHGGKTYSFIAVDATLNPGPKKVFNFFGRLDEEKFNHLAKLKREAASSDHIVYFGHFPSSCVVSDPPLSEVINGGLVYLSGHLHTLAGLAPQLYTLHHSGTPELELGDWKENRRYRVLAVDNGLLSFVDMKHGTWPVAIITNPKNSDFLAPHVENIENIFESKFVRIIAFSPNEIMSVRVKINKEGWRDCTKVTENIFTAHWDPKEYVGRENTIKAEVSDGFGDITEISQTFVVDKQSVEKLRYSLYARLILMCSPHTILRLLWILAFLGCIAPPVLVKYSPAVAKVLLGAPVTINVELFTRHKFIFRVYCLTCLYITFGPWHVGEILSGHLGFVFPWAVVVKGSLLPSFYPFIFSFVHLTFFHQPLLWALVFKLRWRGGKKEDNKFSLALTNIPVTLVLSLQAILLVLLYFYPSNLGIFKEICRLLAPVEISTIVIGFMLNAVVSFHIRDLRNI